MNTEQLKTAEEIFAEQMEDYKTRLMASILDFHSKHPIKELTDFASQESKRAVEKDRESRWISVKEKLPEEGTFEVLLKVEEPFFWYTIPQNDCSLL